MSSQILGKIPGDRIKKRFTPVGNKVALQVIKQTESKGGIVLPETNKQNPESPQAWVIAVGPECKEVKEGDLLIFNGGTPGDVILLGEDRIIMVAESQIAGIMDSKS